MIPEVPVDDFFHSILPPLPRSSKGDLVEEVIAKLKENDTIKNDRWVAFEVDPREHSEKEPQAFKGLTDIWNDVISAAKKVDGSLEQTLGLVVSGHVYIHSDQSRLCQPDAFNKLYSKIQATTAQTHNDTANARRRKSPEEYDYVYDIANPYQFKKGDGVTQIIEDFSKVVYDMEQVLARDPCRRFTFGTTIENRTTRMWFMSRAYLLRSTSFDFMTDHRRLVHLFLSLAFSSLRDLGWDTTMSFSHVDSCSRRQYTIDVDGQQFTTTKVLSDASADSPLGRATRVWKVKDSAGQTRVLKDVWLETDRKEEHLIVEDILTATESIKSDRNLNFRAELEKRMLKPMEHCRVPVYDKTVEGEPDKGEPDDTGAIMLRGYDLGSAKLVKVLPDKASTPALPSSITLSMAGDRDYIPSSIIRLADGLDAESEHLEPSVSSPQVTLEQVDQTDATNVAQRKVVFYSAHHRYHYRIVFEQCATTMYDERNLGNVLRALMDVSIALWIMCLAGWVHRDISGGNVYWFAHAEMGLLGDFEYAVHQSEERHHDVRTGTPFFMAAETIGNDYIYAGLGEEVLPKKPEVILIPQRKSKTSAPVVRKPEQTGLAFSYNPLHDLESIWWILVYVILFNDVDDERLRSPKPDSRQTMMDELFHGQMEESGRQKFFRTISRGFVDNVEGCLSPSFAPVLELLIIFAFELFAAYKNAEKTHPDKIDDNFFEIHGTFTGQLGENFEALSNINLIPVKATAVKRPNPTLPEDTDSVRPSKRSRTSVNAESSGSGSRTGNKSLRQARQRSSKLRQ
ncbi:hypothetical protein FB446DRAFT_758794 [Lentinula raphanica]|nr:hypothetical protein FB446DRAFT_758794 [Lentinula raphanica]